MGGESMDPQTNPKKARRIDKSIEQARVNVEGYGINGGGIVPAFHQGHDIWLGKDVSQSRSEEIRDAAVKDREEIAITANEERGVGSKVADALTGGKLGDRVDEIAVAQFVAEKADKYYNPEYSAMVKEDREKVRAEKEAERATITGGQEMIQHDSVVPAAEGDTFADVKEVDTREQLVAETMRVITSLVEGGDIDGAIRNAEILKKQLSDLKIQKNAVNNGETGLVQ